MNLSVNLRNELLKGFKDLTQSNNFKVQAFYNAIAVSDQETVAMGNPANAELKNTTEVDLAIGEDEVNFIVNKIKVFGYVTAGSWSEIAEIELEAIKGEIKDFTDDGGGIYRIRTLILSM